jgi:DNA polymerase sigma
MVIIFRDITELIVQRVCPAKDRIFGVGSSMLRSYLPESDIDLTLITSKYGADLKKSLESIFLALFSIINEESNQRDIIVRNIEFVNARTNVVHCVVNNTNVDITVNQFKAFSSLVFLEEADRAIGCNHLFKKSVILIKV